MITALVILVSGSIIALIMINKHRKLRSEIKNLEQSNRILKEIIAKQTMELRDVYERGWNRIKESGVREFGL